MKRKIFLICVLLIVSMMVASNYKYLKHEEQDHKIKESNIAIMVYDDEIDNYVKQSNVPKGAKYSLNEELTKCEAGGKVTEYSKVYGTLKYELNRADYCYVYFDVDNTPSYAIYSETDNSLIFYKNNDEVGSEYNGRVVTAKYDDIENSVYTYDSVNKVPNTPWYEYASVIKSVSVSNEITPISTAMWFRGLVNLENINLTNINTSQVTTMESMFDGAGELSSSFNLNLGDKFDTSQVTNMEAMFYFTGHASQNFTLNLRDKFDTSNVTNMTYMFCQTGWSSLNFTLDLGDKFDTSNVTTMYVMFNGVGQASSNFTLDLGNKFDTSKVTNMAYMFNWVGYKSNVFTLNLGNKFDTSKVTDMSAMFANLGRNTSEFVLDLGDKFDTSNVTNMADMFNYVGHLSSSLEIKLGDKFDTSKVTTMYRMFVESGANASNYVIDVSKFNVLPSCDLTRFAYNSASKIILGEGWSNATLVSQMFYENSSTPLEIVNAPANIQSYNFAADNRVVTFTTI